MLSFRHKALQKHNLCDNDILPFYVHSEAQKEFMQWFRKSKMAKRALQCCSQLERKSSKGGGKGERYQRNLRSQMRVALGHTYGHPDWMHLLLAAGADGINEHMVQAYNDEINHRTLGVRTVISLSRARA